MDAGIRTDLGIKLFGDDLEILKQKAAEIERIVRKIPGAADVGSEQISGQPMLSVTVDRKALARYGVSARQVLDAVGTVGGLKVGEILEPERRFPLVVRLAPSQRHDPAELKHVLIATASGQRLPLELLADLSRHEGPATILRMGTPEDRRSS